MTQHRSGLFWRAVAAGLRRSGHVLTRISDRFYEKSRPKMSVAEHRLVDPNKAFRNCHAGKRCFVIGNGPSIKNQDLSLLHHELTFVMNGFWKHDVLKEWQPTYYFFSDAILFDRSRSSMEFFENVKQLVQGSTFFAPLSKRDAIVDEGLLPLDKTRFYAVLGRYLDEVEGDENFDLVRPLPDVLSVAQLALIAAIYMGCSPIYLMGVDYDWLSHHGNGAFYFFPGLTLTNHPEAAGKLGPYDQEMQSLVKVWKGYRKIAAFAEAKGSRILNATHGGFLDVFERASYESLFDSTVSSGIRLDGKRT